MFPPDFGTGMTLSLLLVLVTFALVGVYWRLIGNRDYTTVTGRGYSARPMALGKLRWVAFAIVLLYFLVAVVLPVGMLIQTSFARVSASTCWTRPATPSITGGGCYRSI